MYIYLLKLYSIKYSAISLSQWFSNLARLRITRAAISKPPDGFAAAKLALRHVDTNCSRGQKQEENVGKGKLLITKICGDHCNVLCMMLGYHLCSNSRITCLPYRNGGLGVSIKNSKSADEWNLTYIYLLSLAGSQNKAEGTVWKVH